MGPRDVRRYRLTDHVTKLLPSHDESLLEVSGAPGYAFITGMYKS
jgi:hypothetical protein